MTTIAWDGTTLAADRQATCASGKRAVRKLFECGDYVFAGAGDFADVHHVRAWLESLGTKEPKPPPTFDENQVYGLAVRKRDRAAFLIEGKTVVLTHIRERVGVTGSGHAYARAAMALGKTAREAVLLASRFDPYTGLGVDAVRIGGSRRK